ncbi:MAG: SNF2-related protein [Gammaproteobacteria bacterium]
MILDEAQAIKNAGANQTRAVKQLSAHARIALTGTAIERRLGDLWAQADSPLPRWRVPPPLRYEPCAGKQDMRHK